MMDFLNSFKSLVKVEVIRTDNNVFRLHYKFTVIMLIVFSILLTSKQYFGDPIQCQVTNNKAIIEAYCWIYGTYINEETVPGGLPGLGTDHTKISPWDKRAEDAVIWQQYYQWVCIAFCLQALFFYIPRYLWKTWEGGRLRMLVSDLNNPILTRAWNQTSKTQLVQYILTGKNFHKLYAIRYIVCEVLNFINVVLQVFLMNWFLGGQFFLYGFSVLETLDTKAMNRVFPKLTKCQYYDYGPSGQVQNHDALCVLSLNILNEKLFIVLWFWLFFLSLVTLLSLVYRIIVVLVPKLRILLVMAQVRSLSRRQVSLLINNFSYGDFFVLYYVGKNVNPIVYQELLLEICNVMKTKRPYNAYPGFEINNI